MKISTLDRAFAFAMVPFSLYMIVQSMHYGVLGANVTGSGFFPFISGLIILLSSAAILANGKARAELGEETIGLTQLKPLIGISAATAIFVALADAIGMIPLTLVYIPAVAYCIERPTGRRGHILIWSVAAVATALFYLLFDRALHIPMPWGFWK